MQRVRRHALSLWEAGPEKGKAEQIEEEEDKNGGTGKKWMEADRHEKRRSGGRQGEGKRWRRGRGGGDH